MHIQGVYFMGKQDRLVDGGLLSAEKLSVIEAQARRQKRDFWDVICEDEFTAGFPDNDLAAEIERLFGIESFIPGGGNRPDMAAVNLLDAGFASRHMLLPVKIEGNRLSAALADPFNQSALEELELIVPYMITPLYTPWPALKLLLDTYYGKRLRGDMSNQFRTEHEAEYKLEPDDDIGGAPSVKIMDSIIDAAILKNASDIHLEPHKDDVRVRFRIDGLLTEFERIDRQIHQTLISRLKVMGGMDISEKRLPQDGRFIDTKKDIKIDFRLSTVPTIFGEKAVIRLLYEKTALMDKTELGFSSEALASLNKLFNSSHGAILLTGPTGSGKSTTMAAFLRELNTGDTNITTIEDPVENVIPGINQININPKAGFNFPDALRSILRQDPDIIMVGEIREPDTAKLAINSALTGHLVLSTLHTNDAVSAIYRLIDMNVADYLVYAAIRGVISQRLVRRLCPKCKRETPIGRPDGIISGLAADTPVYESAGCHACDFTGYSGRFAIYEIFIPDAQLLGMFSEKKSYEDIKAHLAREGMKTLWDCGLLNVINGNTSFAEIRSKVLE